MATSSWLRDFEEFADNGTWTVTAHRRRLLDNARELLSLPLVQSTPIETRVQFLLSRDITLREIERLVDETGVDEDMVSFLKSYERFLLTDNSTNANQKSSKGNKEVKQGAATGGVMWRPGMTVYACEDPLTGHYTPIPLLAYDETRGADHFKVSFLAADGTVEAPRYLAGGLKGVVADRFASIDILTVNMEVIAAVSKPFRGHYEEHVVVSVGTETVDIQHVKSGEVTRNVALCDVRTYEHPLLLEARRVERTHSNKQTVDRVLSTSVFPTLGARARSANVSELTGNTSAKKLKSGPNATPATLHERQQMGCQISSYQRYSDLDRETPPEFLATYASYLERYGEGLTHPKQMPLHPVDVTFGFPGLGCIQAVEGHRPRLRYNPILEIAAQCCASNSFYVDADFPPSTYSLYGDTGTAPNPKIQWRRASELLSSPHIISASTKPFELSHGVFTPTWLGAILYQIVALPEFEECISPTQDGFLYGAYTVRVYLDSQWCYMALDDFFPYDTETKKFASLVSSNPNEIYPMLMEKALAKLMGCYSALALKPEPQFASPRSAWDSFSSGHAQKISLKLLPKRSELGGNLEEILGRENGRCMLLPRVAAKCTTPQASMLTSMGFSLGDYCLLISTYRHTVNRELYFYVTNPWSCLPPCPAEYQTFLLKELTSDVVTHMNSKLDRPGCGVWLTWALFVELFESLFLMWNYSNAQKGGVEGCFAAHKGGSIFDTTLDFAANPQYYLNLPQSSEVTIEFRLSAKTQLKLRESKLHRDALRLHMHLLKSDGFEVRLPPHARPEESRSSDLVDLVDDEDALQYPAVLLTACLPSGAYLIIPDVGQAQSEERFCLRVFSEYSFTLRPLV